MSEEAAGARSAARIRWTREDNLDVVRCYLLATESDGRGVRRIGYGQRMLHEWSQLRPDREVSVQRITDQLRFIRRTKKVSLVEEESIRRQLIAEGKLPAGASSPVATGVESDRDVSLPSATAAVDLSDAVVPAVPSDEERDTIECADSASCAGPVAAVVSGAELSVAEARVEDPSTAPRRPSEDVRALVPGEGSGEDTTVQLDIAEEERTWFRKLHSLYREYSDKVVSDRPRLPAARSRGCKLATPVSHVNEAIGHMIQHLESQGASITLECIDNLVYSAAKLVLEELPAPPARGTPRHGVHTGDSVSRPPWLERLERRIHGLRQDVSRLTSFARLHPEPCGLGKNDRVHRIYGVKSVQEASLLLEVKKMELAAAAGRVKRYKAAHSRFVDNTLFKRNQGAFFAKLRSSQDETPDAANDSPDPVAVEKFWSDLYTEALPFRRGGWVDRLETRCRGIPEQDRVEITLDMMRSRLSRMANWKSPGCDRIHTYWWKHLTKVHPFLVLAFQDILDGISPPPIWFADGVTTLIFKKGDRSRPENYRPITCLPTVYKAFTAVLGVAMWQHIDNNSILADEQTGCTPGRGGCSDQLLLDKMITAEAQSRHRNLAMAWIDFRKAFDSVAHAWLREMLIIYRFAPNLVDCLHSLMPRWRTRILLPGGGVGGPIHIRRGIFQGDSLSPLLFCLALNPISIELSSAGLGYECGPPGKRSPVSHLWYMDDLKLFSRNTTTLESSISTVEAIAGDFGMSFNTSKSAWLVLHRGQASGGMPDLISLDQQSSFSHLATDASYRYLGLAERAVFAVQDMRSAIRKEFKSRLRRIAKTFLNSVNFVKAVNAFAMPVVLYSLALLDWPKAEVEELDRLLRRELVLCRAHHPKASTLRLYLPRSSGGRGFLSVEHLRWRTEIRIARYLDKSRHIPLLDILREYQLHLPPTKSLIHRAEQHLEDLGLQLEAASKSSVRSAVHNRLRAELQDRPLQGRYWRRLASSGLDMRLSLAWLASPSLRREAEGSIIAAQEQMVMTRNFYAHVMKSIPLAEDVCRRCGAVGETLDHVLGCCPVLAKSAYIKRHNLVVRALHWAICKHRDLPGLASSAGRHTVDAMVEFPDGGRLLWEVDIPTDNSLSANRPDLVLRDRDVAILIDVSVPLDVNVVPKGEEKISKYEPLRLEVCRLWALKSCAVRPVIVGALGGVAFDAPDHLKRLCGSSTTVYTLQQWALLGSLSIIRSVIS